jgi:WD40 repeat protein/tRNA A-37 threonylcarbamoyl transferase component Bud32
MAQVYLAEQTSLHRSVAIKVLRPELLTDKTIVKRFEQEAKAAAGLIHPNIVQVYAFGQQDGIHYIAQEYVQGLNLRQFLNRKGPPELLIAYHIMRQVASALAVAGDAGIVHRDIKPENILMAHDDDGWVPKIADFGIVATRESARNTQDGSSLLTPQFAAPEQWLGAEPATLDGRTDLYALGGLLFEMLTGQSVFAAEGKQSWAQMHLHALPHPPSSIRRDLANWIGLDALVLRLLAKERADRPQDVAEAIALLDDIVYVPPQEPAPIALAQASTEPAARVDSVAWDTGEGEAPPIASLQAVPAAVNEPAIHLAASRHKTAKKRIPLRAWIAAGGLLLAAAFATEQILVPPVQSRALAGQQDSVFAVAFSPNGLTLASGSHDNTIQIWDVKDEKALSTLRDNVESVAWSPDGVTVAAGIWDNTIKLWDVNSGQVMVTMQGHTDRAAAVAFSPDGRTLASASWDRTIKLWDVASGQVLRTLTGHTDRVLSVAFSPDGHMLVSGGADQTVKLWDESSGVLLRTLSGHTGAVNSVAFSPDGRRVASGSSDHTIRLWDASNGLAERTLTGHTGAVRSVAFSPIRTVLASGSSDSTIRLWDTSTGLELRTLKGHSASVLSVAFGPLGYTLASGSADKTVRLWGVAGIGK